jgi:hypothetical protein
MSTLQLTFKVVVLKEKNFFKVELSRQASKGASSTLEGERVIGKLNLGR